MLASLRRWTDDAIPTTELPVFVRPALAFEAVKARELVDVRAR